MGNKLNRIWDLFFHTNIETKLVLVGLDAAGKTTITYQFKMGENVKTIPTIGFNVEQIKYKNITFVMWDIGGHEKAKKLFHQIYTDNANAIIFVVDSSDKDRYVGCKEELHYIL